MIETNFKHTEIGLIPHDWEVKMLGEIADVKTGPFGSALHASDYVLTGTPIITVEHIGNFRISKEKDIPQIGEADRKRLSAYSLKEGDIVFSRVGSVDRCSYVSDNENGWLFSGRLLRVRPSFDVSSKYLVYHLSSIDARNRVLSVAVGLAMPSINTRILQGISVSLPPTLAEQERIAGALSSIDTLIGALNEQIEKKRHIKQGTMQQLLTGKKRLAGFTGEWKNVRLGDLLAYEQPTRYLVQSTEYTELGIPVLTAGKTFILGYTIEDSGIFNKLPVIIFDDFVVESKYVTFPFKVKSSAMKMLSLRDATNNLRFIYEKMQCIDFPIADHKRHWISEYSQIEITIPDPAEQSAIAAVLSGMDAEIAALEQKRDKYIAIKSGMMQDLLTGKIRLV